MEERKSISVSYQNTSSEFLLQSDYQQKQSDTSDKMYNIINFTPEYIQQRFTEYDDCDPREVIISSLIEYRDQTKIISKLAMRYHLKSSLKMSN